jgi:hypothetical protein
MPGPFVILPLRRHGLAVGIVLATLARAIGVAVTVVVVLLEGVQQVKACEVQVGIDEVVEGGSVDVLSEPLQQSEGLPLDWCWWQQRRAEL